MILRPRGYSVEPSFGEPFITSEESLAHAVAQTFDKIDPLPFPPHDCTEEVTAVYTYEQVEPISTWCEQCGTRVS